MKYIVKYVSWEILLVKEKQNGVLYIYFNGIKISLYLYYVNGKILFDSYSFDNWKFE